MPRKKIIDPMQAMGVTKVEEKGNSVSLYIDPNKAPAAVRRNIAAGMSRMSANASTMWNDAQYPAFFEETRDPQNARPHEKIRMAMKYFHTDPLVGKIIELMKTFSNDGFRNEHHDPKVKKFYDDWCDAVDMELVLGWMFLEYFRSGNVVTYRELIPVTKNFKINRLSAAPYATEGEAKNKFTKKMIPGAYTVLNPMMVHVNQLNGYKDSLYVNYEQLDIGSTGTQDAASFTVMGIPQDMVDMRKFKDGVPLDEKNVRRVLRMRQPYEPYGSVMMERAFNALYEKNKLRQMDMSMVNSVINQIIKVTIGNDQFPATPKMIKNVAEAFQNVGKSQIIFWNHTLTVEVIRPDTKVLNEEKYFRVDGDIRSAFGISEFLTGGGSSKGINFATSYLSMKAFTSNLMEARRDISRWLRQEYADIAEAMGFDSCPNPSFNPLSLTDEIAEKQAILQMLDRGVISYESAQSRLGYDPQIELERRLKEKPLVDDGVLGVPTIPPEVSPTLNPSPQLTVGKPKKKQPKKTKPGGSQMDGRPPTGTGKKMPNRKTAKIKGQGGSLELTDDAEHAKGAVKTARDFLKT